MVKLIALDLDRTTLTSDGHLSEANKRALSGVMTFTSFIALSFFTQTSFNDQMALKNILSEESMNNIFRTLFYTLFTTIIVEAIGAWILWWEIRDLSPSLIPNKIFFAIFHAV